MNNLFMYYLILKIRREEIYCRKNGVHSWMYTSNIRSLCSANTHVHMLIFMYHHIFCAIRMHLMRVIYVIGCTVPSCDPTRWATIVSCFDYSSYSTFSTSPFLRPHLLLYAILLACISALSSFISFFHYHSLWMPFSDSTPITTTHVTVSCPLLFSSLSS